MSAELFLTGDELEQLTGYRRAHEQRRWLEKRRWLHETNAAGVPRVARAYFERRLVGEVKVAEPPLPSRHNFSALRVVK